MYFFPKSTLFSELHDSILVKKKEKKWYKVSKFLFPESYFVTIDLIQFNSEDYTKSI